MTQARAEPVANLSLGPADAAPPAPLAAPHAAVAPPPIVVAGHQFVMPPPPVIAAVAQPQANNQPDEVPPLNATPPPAPQTAAQSLATRLLALDPNMTLEQLTGILNILGPNRHTRTVAANLLNLAPQPMHQPPASASASNHPPPANPLTGARIVTPQRRAQPAPQSAPGRSLLDLLSAPSRKRSPPLPPSSSSSHFVKYIFVKYQILPFC